MTHLRRSKRPCDTCRSYSCYKKNCGVNATMKLSGTTGKRALARPDAVGKLQAASEIVLGETLWYNLCALAADVFDLALRGDECYMILGATKDKSAMSVTVVLNGERDTRYGNSGVEELLASLADLLTS